MYLLWIADTSQIRFVNANRDQQNPKEGNNEGAVARKATGFAKLSVTNANRDQQNPKEGNAIRLFIESRSLLLGFADLCSHS